MTYGIGEKISVSLYHGTKNIAVLLGDGQYDVLTTNGYAYLGYGYIGIRSDELHKAEFAFEKGLITSTEPIGFEPSGYIRINHYATTEKLRQMVKDYEETELGGKQSETSKS